MAIRLSDRDHRRLDGGNREWRRSGSTLTSVTTGVDGCTYSPGETLRALIDPSKGAVTATSATAFSACASCARASARDARAVVTLCYEVSAWVVAWSASVFETSPVAINAL